MDKGLRQIGVMHAFLCFELYTKLKTSGCVKTLGIEENFTRKRHCVAVCMRKHVSKGISFAAPLLLEKIQQVGFLTCLQSVSKQPMQS